MRILAVVSGGGQAGARLLPAAVGLAGRGHEMAWVEKSRPPAVPESARLLPRRRDLWAFRADVVVSDSTAPLRPALAGWQTGATCLVMALEAGRVGRWRLPAHWAWHSLHAFGLIAPEEAEAFRQAPRGLDLDRLGLWSDEPPALTPDPAHPDAEVLERACERALSRHRSRAARPAVFLDRDGTINAERDYVLHPDELALLPNAAAGIRHLRSLGLPVVVVTNQSPVGRGWLASEVLDSIHERLTSLLAAEGTQVDGIYACPHAPGEGCPCRKPGTALLERAAGDFGADLSLSFVVGDKATDIEAGRRVGATTILVETGYGKEQRFADGETPDLIAADLHEAARLIGRELGSRGAVP